MNVFLIVVESERYNSRNMLFYRVSLFTFISRVVADRGVCVRSLRYVVGIGRTEEVVERKYYCW